jgi:hypothetical protein
MHILTTYVPSIILRCTRPIFANKWPNAAQQAIPTTTLQATASASNVGLRRHIRRRIIQWRSPRRRNAKPSRVEILCQTWRRFTLRELRRFGTSRTYWIRRRRPERSLSLNPRQVKRSSCCVAVMYRRYPQLRDITMLSWASRRPNRRR